MNLKGLKVIVVGIARSGLNAALFLRSRGAAVYATDNGASEEISKSAEILRDNGADVETGKHTESFVRGKELMVVSPGVDSRSDIIGWARKDGMPVISELELGYLFCKGRIIAVTGTNGKTTTAALIGNIIKRSGAPVVVCGNIGTPFAGEIPNITPEHYVVLEVSSFQLEWIDKFKPYVSIILNVTDDHLDRHRDFNEYAALKKRIFINQGKEDFLILNDGDDYLKGLDGLAPARTFLFSRDKEVRGAFLRDKEIILNTGVEPRNICSLDAMKLKGVHNLDNVMASALACRLIGLGDKDITDGIISFEPLRHRFQHVAEIGGVEFIDDSKATNVDATLKALLSLTRPAVLIAGGRDKEGNFGLIRDVVKQRVRSVVLIGEAKEKIKGSLGDITSVHEAGSLEDAVESAKELAREGDVVLLSPMCASFDMFKDYAERGEVFTKAVDNLKRRLCVR